MLGTARRASTRRTTVLARPWTRAATAATGSHLLYELLAGAAVPYASRTGPRTTPVMWAAATTVAYRQAGRQPPSRDPVFAALNGANLSAVLAHFLAWPRTSRLGLPWLTECEGLSGLAIGPYNVILHASAVTAVAGLAEHRLRGAWGVLVPVLLLPWLVGEQRREFDQRRHMADAGSTWWTRRLAAHR